MKALHKISNPKHANPRFGWIRVLNNFVYAGNDNAYVRIPLLEVFPKDLIEDGEELYFNAEEWGKVKMHDAQTMSREGLMFTAYKKGKSTGIIKALRVEEFTNLYGYYPDVEAVIPAEDAAPWPVANIWTTGKNLSAIYDALDYNDAPTLSFVKGGSQRIARVTFKGQAAIGVICILDRGITDAEAAVIDNTPVLVPRVVEPEEIAELKEKHTQAISDLEEEHREAVDELKKELEQAQDRVKELEQEAAEPIDPEELDDTQLFHVFGSKPIVCISQNLVDDQFLTALSKLTDKARPHELLRQLENLANPIIAQQLDEVIDTHALLY